MGLVTYNGVHLPAFMYGTAWKKQATTRLVRLAVATGFRALDTANQLIHYEEALVGEALVELQNAGLGRRDLFLQTKFTPAHGQDDRTPYDRSAGLATQVRQSFERSLQHLHTDMIDSYVLHGPYSRRGLAAADWEVWGAIEALYEAGKVRMIGVSNVTGEQLAELCARARHKPMVVQNRCYAALGWDAEVRRICRAEQIVYQGFSLLTGNPGVLADPEIRRIATRLGSGPAQVIFRFAMDVGMLPLTGTSSEQHMKEDLQAEALTLTPEEVARIETIGVR